jgi:cyanate permease
MEESFSWQRFERISKALESLGYLVAVFGPLVGIALLIIGDWTMRLMGIGVIVASALVAAYHISFSLLMNAVHDLTKRIESQSRQ